MRKIGLHGGRRGFTLTETIISAFMMVLVSVLLSSAWNVFGRPAISAIARARIAQEANLAAAALANDIGMLARAPDNLRDSSYQQIHPGPDYASISFTVDDGTGSNRIISYAIDPPNGSQLVRTDSLEGSRRIVATLVAGSGFQVTSLNTLPNRFGKTGVQIEITFTHPTYERDPTGAIRREHTRRFTLFVPDP